MTFFILVVTLLGTSASAGSQCSGGATAPALDHVVIAVRDLDHASAQFHATGFRLKQGRLHANNLLNRHVKFRDATSIELMTVAGEPGDAMAREYADLIAEGGGGVFVALTVPAVDEAARNARTIRLETLRSASGPWQFVSFAPTSPAAAVFFSSGGGAVNDPDSLVSHTPDAGGLAEAWLEGGGELGALLEQLGAARCGDARAPDGRTGERWGLSHGTLVVVPARPGARPRVLGVVLRSRAPGARTAYPHPAFWVEYRFEQPASGRPDGR